MMPAGFRFNPTDEELIEILQRKVSGEEMPVHDQLIVETNVYELDPHNLQWDHTMILSDNERYCYYMRKTDSSREVLGRGWWRSTGHVKKIYDNNEHVVGYKRPLTFLRFMDNERKRKNAVRTDWIMHEYSLDADETERRLCKIKYKGKLSVQEELESIKGGYGLRNVFEVKSSADYVCEELRQPQTLQLDNVYQPSTSMQLDFVGEPYSEGRNSMNVRLDFVEEQQQKIIEQVYDPNASYDPILTHITGDQLVQSNLSEELQHHSLWSWDN